MEYKEIARMRGASESICALVNNMGHILPVRDIWAWIEFAW